MIIKIIIIITPVYSAEQNYMHVIEKKNLVIKQKSVYALYLLTDT